LQFKKIICFPSIDLNFEAKLVLQIFTSSKNFKIWAETLSIRTSLKNNKVFKFTFLEYIFFLLKMIFFILSRTDTLCTDNNVSFCLFFLFNSYTHSHTYTHTHTHAHTIHTLIISNTYLEQRRTLTLLPHPLVLSLFCLHLSLSLARANAHTFTDTFAHTHAHKHTLARTSTHTTWSHSRHDCKNGLNFI